MYLLCHFKENCTLISVAGYTVQLSFSLIDMNGFRCIFLNDQFPLMLLFELSVTFFFIPVIIKVIYMLMYH
jgi:hypothetical protein